MGAYRMAYAGSVAAVLPGFGAAIYGGVGLVSALALAVAIGFGFSDIRNGLRTLTWYRWFIFLIMASTLALAAVLFIAPERRTAIVLSWLLTQIIVLVGSYPYFAGDHPPNDERIPRG